MDNIIYKKNFKKLLYSIQVYLLILTYYFKKKLYNCKKISNNSFNFAPISNKFLFLNKNFKH